MLAKHVDAVALAIIVAGLLVSGVRANRLVPNVNLSGIRIHNAVLRANVCPFTRVKFLSKFQRKFQ